MKLKDLLPLVHSRIEIFYLGHTQVYEDWCGINANKRKIQSIIKNYGDKEIDIISHREDKISIDIYDNG